MLIYAAVVLCMVPWVVPQLVNPVTAQQPADSAGPSAATDPATNNSAAQSAAARAEADLAKPASPAAAAAPSPDVVNPGEMTLWQLYVAGGIFMIPITILSFVALAYTIERFLALRSSKVMPPELVEGLGEMSAQGGFEPRRAYRLCQEYPSTLANVVRTMLLKVGRPVPEIEQAIKDASDSESTKLYANVRPIALSVTVEPMLGLLGTVQGIIIAFGQMSNTSETVNRTQLFANGIYTALITTFGGLVVAIPAAIVVFYFEQRIMNFFHRIDDVMASLLPQVEKFEGKLRVNRQQLAAEAAPPVTTTPVAAPPVMGASGKIPTIPAVVPAK
ncbi:MAG: MotA/TolQ/ExbB proton channel family protein [Pirellulales bacterium]|nr:MotA/TolQ/ExbB proton channel family protein [Pirellulales bacterium]